MLTTVLFWILALLTGASAVAVVVSQNVVRMAIWLLFALGGTSGIFFLLGADFVGATQLFVYVGGTLVLVVFGVMLTAQGPFITMKTGAAEWAITTVVGLSLFAVLAVTAWPGRVDPDKVTAYIHQLGSRDPAVSQRAAEVLLNLGDAARPQLEQAVREHPKDAEHPDDLIGVRAEALLRAPEQMQDPATSMNSAILGQSFLGITPATPESDLAGLPAGKQHVAPGLERRNPVSYLLPFEIVSVHLLVVLIGAAYLARAKRRRGVVA
jgi:NADH-quinone oxidoreductase subunit J